ncbi:DUF1572 domain-containing protein [Rhabdobacter roseus]|uniref:DUF1572 domain-containing protein n=1 Tax=Rhabdobacter roseus TaxID=1655419 RepID=A0A840TNY8_9BACT|nr:DUF1572 domain-containing protein [Rhabdobacter roseus]MBB5285441.1 hypothetical protein [Rhabdobacter roseus]
MEANYLQSTRQQFLYYKSLGEKAMAQVPDEALHWAYNEETNSIAVIVQHLWGNMRSRWTDFLTTDGEKPWRDRDAEFEGTLITRAALLAQWEEGWNYLLGTLDALQPSDLARTVYIRNEAHTVLEAINRQLAHYPYHVGQIVHIAKMVQAGAWQTLTIARNASRGYNEEKFGDQKN